MSTLEEACYSLIYLNRFIGDSALYNVSEIAHPHDVAKSNHELRLSEFISKYTHWPGFITSLVFSRFAWESGLKVNCKEYPGYTFLDFLFRSPEIDTVLVFGEPSIIQRRGSQSWKKYWPLYWYLGISKLLSDLDSDGISKSSLKTWLSNEIKIKNLIVDLLIAKSFPSVYDKQFWRYLKNLFCHSFLLSAVVYLISLLPSSVCFSLLKLSPNKSKYGFT